MTIALTAPISETDYRNSPMLALSSDFTGDKVTDVLNKAWSTLENSWAKQPLSSHAQTETYSFPGRRCNATPEGIVQITPPLLPIISVQSINFSSSVVNDGWSPSTQFDIVSEAGIIRVYDALFSRGDYGICQLAYTSGYTTVPDDLKEACLLLAATLWSAGFFPTQASASVTPEWVYGTNRENYYAIKRTMDVYKRVR